MSVTEAMKLMKLRNLEMSRARYPARFNRAGQKIRAGDKHFERAEELQRQIDRLMCPVRGYKLYPDAWPGEQINLFGGDHDDTPHSGRLPESQAQGLG